MFTILYYWYQRCSFIFQPRNEPKALTTSAILVVSALLFLFGGSIRPAEARSFHSVFLPQATEHLDLFTLTPPIVVTAPTGNQPAPSTFVVPISVSNITGDGIFAFQFNIIYNPAVIEPSGANFGCSTAGTIAASLSPTCNVDPAGTLLVSVSGSTPIASGAGTILNVTFITKGVSGNASPLNLQDVFFFNSGGQVANTPVNGQVTLTNPTLTIANTSTGAEPNLPNVFTVTLSQSPTANVTVDYATGGGSATAGNDYTPTSGTLTFLANTPTLSQTISVPTLDDAFFEGTENFNMTLSSPTNATITGTNPAVGTIADDDSQPVLTIANTTTGAEPGTANVFTVTLSNQTTSQVTVHYATTSGSAAANSDFTATSGDLTFAANTPVLSQTISVPTLDDAIFEGSENFTILLSAATNASIAGTNPATGTIADDEVQPTVSIAATTPGAEPATSNVFTVTLSGQTASQVTVNYLAGGGSATSGVDYSATSGTITFLANTSTLTQTITVPTLDDSIFEGTETFNMTLSSPVNATISGSNPAVGTIADNEAQPTLSIVNTTAGAEPATANVFTVTLSNQTTSPVTVNYLAGGGTAASGADYTPTSGTLTFTANTSTLTQTITVPTLDDAVFEGPENFNLTLSSPTNATISGPNPGLGTITDNEVQPTLTIAATGTGAEPATPTVFTVTLSGQTTGTVTVHYATANGSATAGSDYSATSGDLTFAANTSTLTQTVSVPTLDDLIVEGPETLTMTLSAPTNATIGGTNPATGTIADNESQPTISIANTTAGAEPATANVFTVTLSNQTTSQVTVHYATSSGSATSGADFTATSGDLTFLANTSTLTQTITVPTLDDGFFEGTENFTVLLSLATNATIAGTNPAVGTIADNESQPTVSISTTSTGGEPGTPNVFTVTLSNQTAAQVTVNYAAGGGTATSGADYGATAGTITFAPNTSTLTQTITVPTVDDLIFEGTENFNVTLSSPSNATITGPNPAVGSITDNESQPTVSVSNTTAGAEPSTANVFTVTLSGQTTSQVTVNYAAGGGTATSGSDYAASSGTITFAANTSTLTQTINVATIDDVVFEGPENFNMTLSSPVNAAIAGTNPALGTIADNETQPTVSIAATSAGAEPSAPTVFTVTLSGQTTGTVTVNYATASGTATSGSDFTSTSGTVTFAANTSVLSQTVHVPTLDDLVVEGAENFTMTLSSPTNATISGLNPATGTIADNESSPVLTIANTTTGAEPATANVFTVSMSNQTTSAVTVHYATSSGTATSGVDFTATSGDLTFAANTAVLTQTITVPTLDDLLFEGTENFTVLLSSPVNATIAGTNPATGTIADNESQPTVSITTTSTGSEPGTPNVFTVTLSAQTASQVTVNYATGGGTASAGSDYTATSGTITFAANTAVLSQTINVPTLDDNVFEGTENFTMTLSSATNATILGPNPAAGTISDNETQPTLSIANTTAGAEPSTANIFTVTLSGQTTAPVTVHYATANGTATAGSDYTASSGDLTFAANTSTLTQTISVSTLDDLIVEGPETFTMTLSAPTNATLAGPNPATGTIADNESQPVLTIANTTAGAEPGTANVFTVTLSNQSSSQVTVHYATSSGSAASGVDFTPTSGDLTFAANTSLLTQTITVPTLDDSVFEGTENFTVLLSSPTNSTIAGTNPATGTIADNESQPTLSIATTSTGAEPSTPNVFTVTLSGQTAQQVTVNYAAGGGSSTSGVDYAPTNGTLTFAANTAFLSQIITVPTLNDSIFEGTENFSMTLSSPINATIIGSNPAVGTIVDDDLQQDLPPSAAANASDVATPGGAIYTFEVVYSDDIAINIATLDNNDLRVNGPGGFNTPATLINVLTNSNGSPRTASYSIIPPGGFWDLDDNGPYSIVMQANQVADTGGNFVPAGTLGTFLVSTCETGSLTNQFDGSGLSPGTSSALPCLEGDINRSDPNTANSSDGVVDLKDLQWYDNFVNGTFIPATGGPAQPLTVGVSSRENQRRDVAPMSVAGNGCLDAADRQQMVLFTLSLATPGPAGGPSVLNLCPPPDQSVSRGGADTGSNSGSDSLPLTWRRGGHDLTAHSISAEDRRRQATIDPTVRRTVRVMNSEIENGEMLVTIEMDAAGDETRGLFTLNFDPSALSFDQTSYPTENESITLGEEAPEGMLTAVNATTALTGRIVLYLDFNGAIPSGTGKRLVTLRFRTAEGAARNNVTLSPETLQLINGSGSELKARMKRE